MSTNDQRVNIYLKKFLSQQEITENFFDFLQKLTQDTMKRAYPNGGVFAGGDLSASAINSFDIAVPMSGVNSLGFDLVLEPSLASQIPFENTNAIEYFVGVKPVEVPVETEINVKTGLIEYRLIQELVGVKGDPDSVVDDTDGTMTIIVDSVTEAGVSNAGRTVRVYLKARDEGGLLGPKSEVEFFEELTVVWDGSNNKIETLTALGQNISSISVDANDYEVVLLGPSVKRNTDLSLDTTVIFLGKVTGAGVGNTPSIFVNNPTIIFPVGSLTSAIESSKAFLTGGGNVTWDQSTGDLTWSAALKFIMPSRPFDFTIAPTTINAIADGEVLYFQRDLIGGAKTLTKVANGAVPLDPDIEPIIHRQGNDLFFMGGSLELKGDASSTTVGRIDGLTQDTLTFIGADDESDSDPDYATIIGATINFVLIDGEPLNVGMKRLEQRPDVLSKVRLIDLVSTALPSGATVNIDGVAVVDDDLILFTKAPIEGIYKVSGVGAAVVFTQQHMFSGGLAPIDGSAVTVKEGTSYFKTIWERVDGGNWRPVNLAELVNENTGFKDRTESTISFVNGTRTFNIDPVGASYDFVQKGQVRRITTNKNVVIPDVEGLHFIYFDGEILMTTQAFSIDILLNLVFVATVNWDATNNEHILLGEERHESVMDGRTHAYLHSSQGTRYISGLALGNFSTVGAGDNDAHMQASLSDGLIFDEDLSHNIIDDPAPSAFFEQILDPIAEIPIYYRDGALGDWRKIAATTLLGKSTGTGRLAWNEFTGGAWQQTEASNTFHVAYWLFATNNVNEPIILIMGQREDTTLSNAQANNSFASLLFGDLPSLEMKVLFRLIHETDNTFTNTLKSALRDVNDLRQSITTALASFTPGDHGLLSGLQDKDHNALAINIPTPFPGTGTFPATDDDVQKTLDTMDKYFAQLQLKEHPSNKKRVVVTGASISKTDLTQLGQVISNLLMKFDGAEIDFSTGSIFEDDGTTPLGENFTPVSIPTAEYQWYSVGIIPDAVNADNTINIKMLVTAGTGTDAVKANAPKAPFAGKIKLGQVQVQEDSGTILDIPQADILQLGVGSGGEGGAGDANELLRQFDEFLRDSIFSLGTMLVFSIDEDDLTDVASTATFSIVDEGYEFTALGETFISTDLLDPEFLTREVDIIDTHMLAYWDIDSVDPEATYEESRDGGVHFQENTNMSRAGLSDLFEGRHRFTREVDAFTFGFGAGVDPEVLNATTQQRLSQIFERTAQFNLDDYRLFFQRLGSPAGNFRTKIIRDDGTGKPSTVASDIVFTSDFIDALTFSTSMTQQTFTSSLLDLDPGKYHVVAEGDAAYQASFSTGVDEIRVRGLNAGSAPFANAFNGASWTVTTFNLEIEINGEEHAFQTIATEALANNDSDLILNATTTQRYGQEFASAVANAYQRFVFEVKKTEAVPGNLAGNIIVSLVKDVAGAASLLPEDIFAQTPPISIAKLATGVSTLRGVIGDLPKALGTYHMVVDTDALYKASFSSGVDEIAIRADSSSPGAPLADVFNGTSYSPTASRMGFIIEGRPLDLRIKVTSSVGSVILKGIGPAYELDPGFNFGNQENFETQFVDGDLNPTEIIVVTFKPDRQKTVIFDPASAQVYRIGHKGVELEGQKLIFPADTFNVPGELIQLDIMDLTSGSFDNSDDNRRMIADQFLANLDPALNKGRPGRGITLMASDGKFYEAVIKPGGLGFEFFERTV